MLCSISTGKSGSNWLDRLRTSKGFPSGDDLDLDHFLNHQEPNASNSPDTNPSDPTSNSSLAPSDEKTVLNRIQTTEISTENGEKEWLGIMSNVLSELFIIGDTNEISRFSGKKSSRKQTNPKICVLSASTSGDERCSNDERFAVMALPSSGDNSLVEMKDASGEVKLKKERKGGCVDVVEEDEEEEEEEEEEEKWNGDLSGFSRSEVTVIDTSCASWKVDKLVFRRKNVWKIRDKKGKSRHLEWKKRKANLCDKNGGGKKKIRLSILPFGSSKDENGEKRLVLYNDGQNHQNDKRKKTCKEMADISSQVPKKRLPFPRLARKSGKGGSSVIRLKVTSKSKQNGANLPTSYVKDTQRQSKA